MLEDNNAVQKDFVLNNSLVLIMAAAIGLYIKYSRIK